MITLTREEAQQVLDALKWFEQRFACTHLELIDTIRARLSAPEPDAAYGYAKRLAEAIYQKHYKQDSPEWKPLDDTLGVLTQIDNMTSGLVKKPSEQKPVVWMYQDKSTNEVRFQKHMRDFVDYGQTYETPLYAAGWFKAPPQRECASQVHDRREWQGLTDEEMNACLVEADPCEALLDHESRELMRTVEAKLREKNCAPNI